LIRVGGFNVTILGNPSKGRRDGTDMYNVKVSRQGVGSIRVDEVNVITSNSSQRVKRGERYV
jgi:hypothetical protein